MKLEKLLNKLSTNKDIVVTCHVDNGICKIIIEEMWYYNEIKRVSINLGTGVSEENVAELKNFFGGKSK
jgi:uncharacterized protein YijF (DUF1287 family)